MKNKLNGYQKADTMGKSQIELVIKVYDGAIEHLKKATKFYKNEDMQAGYEALEQARKFIVHLYTTLDEEKGGEIAQSLSQLYAFAVEQINFVQATKDISKIDDTVEIFENIRDGWVQLKDEKKTGKPTSNIKQKETDKKREISISL